MKSILHLTNPKLKDCLRSLGLNDLPILGRGMYSLVLDHGDDTVTKVTVDNMSYNWLVQGSYGMGRLRDGSPYKVEVVEDLDAVGDIDLFLGFKPQLYEYELKAVRMKKYTRLRKETQNTEQSKRSSHLKLCFSEAVRYGYTPDAANFFHRCAENWEKNNPEDNHYYELLLACYYFAADWAARPDILSRGNMLGHNGNPMLVDPFHDPELFARVWADGIDKFDNPKGNTLYDLKEFV
ncbi:MAG: hypothetical protein RR280_10305 [Bacteroidaceae bacterium]